MQIFIVYAHARAIFHCDLFELSSEFYLSSSVEKTTRVLKFIQPHENHVSKSRKRARNERSGVIRTRLNVSILKVNNAFLRDAGSGGVFPTLRNRGN